MEATDPLHSGLKLSASWRARFASAGFVKLPQILGEAAVRALEGETERLLWSDGYHKVGRDGSGRPVVINYADKQSDLMFEVSRSRSLVDLAELLMGERVVPLHVEVFEKPVGSDAIAAPHQDHAFYHEHFGETEALAIWLALDEVTDGSGGVEYATTFDRTLLPHDASAAALAVGQLRDGVEMRFEPLQLLRGEAVAHSSYLVHRSGLNQSGKRRRGIAFNYRCSPFRSHFHPRAPE